MINSDFKIALEKAEEVRSKLLTSENSFIPLNDIIAAVKQVSKYREINVRLHSFSNLPLPKNSQAPSYGAMLSTYTKRNAQTDNEDYFADLIINSDYSAEMQRFSVVHELGHLITDIPNYKYEVPNDGKFTISAHINPDITFFSDADLKNNQYLFAEQIANIFALLVLIPENIKIKDLKAQRIERLKERYGVTEEAIYSRMLLSNVCLEK